MFGLSQSGVKGAWVGLSPLSSVLSSLNAWASANVRKRQQTLVAVVALFVFTFCYQQAFAQQSNLSQGSDYQDTEFGEYIYSETSSETREELAKLLVDEHPSIKVFLHGLSMGAGIDEVLDAAVRIDNQRSRDFVTSAASLLPLLKSSRSYEYSRYDLSDLDEPYSADQVIERFLEDRSVLTPFPDWNEGQYHVLLTASELADLASARTDVSWYKEGKLPSDSTRPVFVSIYEQSKSVILDSKERITAAMQASPNTLLPVVFVFNKIRERSIDELAYPKTLAGVQQAYLEEGLMVTTAPQWSMGDHHIMVGVDELVERFDVRLKQDYLDQDEAELWQQVYERESPQSELDKALLLVILPSGNVEDSENEKQANAKALDKEIRPLGLAELSYASSGNSDSLGYILSDGMILNRPEKVAVAKELGKSELPVAIYYVDESRIKPYALGLRGLKAVAQGAGAPAIGINSVPPFGPPGSVPPSPPVPPPPGVPCASPPCRPF